MFPEETTNSTRASWAQEAVDAYTYIRDGDTPVSDIQDLICDLLHLLRIEHGKVAADRREVLENAVQANYIEQTEDDD